VEVQVVEHLELIQEVAELEDIVLQVLVQHLYKDQY
jgi:hypothetical protein